MRANSSVEIPWTGEDHLPLPAPQQVHLTEQPASEVLVAHAFVRQLGTAHVRRAAQQPPSPLQFAVVVHTKTQGDRGQKGTDPVLVEIAVGRRSEHRFLKPALVRAFGNRRRTSLISRSRWLAITSQENSALHLFLGFAASISPSTGDSAFI